MTTGEAYLEGRGEGLGLAEGRGREARFAAAARALNCLSSFLTSASGTGLAAAMSASATRAMANRRAREYMAV